MPSLHLSITPNIQEAHPFPSCRFEYIKICLNSNCHNSTMEGLRHGGSLLLDCSTHPQSVICSACSHLAGKPVILFICHTLCLDAPCHLANTNRHQFSTQIPWSNKKLWIMDYYMKPLFTNFSNQSGLLLFRHFRSIHGCRMAYLYASLEWQSGYCCVSTLFKVGVRESEDQLFDSCS
jgi:hypothetical protein